jgi:hypothetical protein
VLFFNTRKLHFLNIFAFVKGFGTFYTSLLKSKGLSITTSGDHTENHKAKMKSLDSFVDVGMKLKHLSKTVYTSKTDKEHRIKFMKNIGQTLKNVSMTASVFLQFPLCSFANEIIVDCLYSPLNKCFSIITVVCSAFKI